jgi:hypothetical protein
VPELAHNSIVNTEVNTEAEEHDSSDDEDEEDMILADDGEELDDDSDVLTEEGYWAL